MKMSFNTSDPSESESFNDDMINWCDDCDHKRLNKNTYTGL